MGEVFGIVLSLNDAGTRHQDARGEAFSRIWYQSYHPLLLSNPSSLFLLLPPIPPQTAVG
ncbi:hypothetical protein AKJ16_DCAP20200 [Drosera capensis]